MFAPQSLMEEDGDKNQATKHTLYSVALSLSYCSWLVSSVPPAIFFLSFFRLGTKLHITLKELLMFP